MRYHSASRLVEEKKKKTRVFHNDPIILFFTVALMAQIIYKTISRQFEST